MRGDIGMPIAVLVAIIIAVLIILVAVIQLGGIPGSINPQVLSGAYASCCTDYSLAGHCEEGNADPSFSCNNVAKEVSSTGSVPISELAQRTGVPIERRCCNR